MFAVKVVTLNIDQMPVVLKEYKSDNDQAVAQESENKRNWVYVIQKDKEDYSVFYSGVNIGKPSIADVRRLLS